MSSSGMFNDGPVNPEDPIVTTAECVNIQCGADAVLGGDSVFRCACGAQFVSWYAQERGIPVIQKKKSELKGKRVVATGTGSADTNKEKHT